MYALTHLKSHRPTLARKRLGASHGNLEQSPQVRNVLARHSLQAKLKIGAPNDKFEQEADRVADRVMSAPVPPVLQSQVGGIHKPEVSLLQRT